MSRGITIRNYIHLYLVIDATEPAADTQVTDHNVGLAIADQPFICVGYFATKTNCGCLKAVMNMFIALRTKILSAMNQPSVERTPLMDYDDVTFHANWKIRSSRLPLHPGPNLYKILETGGFARSNAQIHTTLS